MVILDTNVLSETLRPRPANSVMAWLRRQPRASLLTTSISQAEMLTGVALLPVGRRRSHLEQVVREIFEIEFAARVLPFDGAAANAYADIAARRQREGRPVATLEIQIAAIARVQGASVATRNTSDFAGYGVGVIDPWKHT